MKRLMIVLTMVFLCSVASAQEEGEEQANTGQDFTRPLTRFDIRQQITQNKGDTHTYVSTLRFDKPILLEGGKAGLLSTRLDIPLVASDAVGRDNPNGDTYEFGFGDILTQFAYIFPKHKTDELGFGIDGFGLGAQLVWPSASKSILGGEKYLVAPLVGAKWNTPQISKGSWFTPVFRYFVDYADYGNGRNRDNISELAIQPQLYINTKEWNWPIDFVHFWASKDIRINFENGMTKGSGDIFIPFDVMLGKMLNESTVLSVEFATPLVNDYDSYDWFLGFRVGYFF
jgi:hypothetical protein